MRNCEKALGILVGSLLLVGCGLGPVAAPTATPLPTNTATALPSPTPTAVPTATATATATPEAAPSPGGEYGQLLDQLRQGSTDIDFTALRMAYAETADYAPYDFGIGLTAEEMRGAFEDKDYQGAIELAGQILDDNYLYLEAHYVAQQAYEALNDSAKAGSHGAVFDGLLNSVFASGDGKTEETAYQVIFIEEEYWVLAALGISDASQGVMEDSGHTYDVFEGTDPGTGARVSLYFNVDRLFESLQ